jgi:hypothetical protein
VCVVQVTNTTPTGIEIRVLTSTRNSGEGFDLRCYIRENVIVFLRENYPESLPVTRLQPAASAENTFRQDEGEFFKNT